MAGELRPALSRLITRWVVLGVAADCALAVVDAALGRPAILTVVYLLPPLAVALVETGERVSVVAGLSCVLALASGAWNHYMLSGSHLYRLGVVVGSGILAVYGAVLRSRAVTARDRMGLLVEFGQIADGRRPLAEALDRVADLLVPAVADYCEIVTLEEGYRLRRWVTRIAGDPGGLARRLAERALDQGLFGMTPDAYRTGQAKLVRLVDDTHLDALASEPADRELLASLRMRSALHVPVRAAGRTLAGLTLAVGPSGRRYGGDDLRFATTVGSRAGLAIENSRLVGELEEARKRMEAIVGSLADAVTIRDVSGRIVYANEAAVQAMGFVSMDEVTDRDPEGLLDEFTATDEAGNPLRMADLPSVRLLRGEPPEPLLLRYLDRRRGAEEWRLLKATPLYDAEGKLEAAVTIIEDLTATKRAERQTSFLSRASDILASSLDYEETLRNVAWLAVPEIADWCVVDLVDDRGRRQHVVAAHRDPERRALAERLRSYEGARPERDGGVGRVIATGKSELYSDISDAVLQASARDQGHLELLRGVGMRSVVIVAMRTGARTLGTLTLVNAESGRRFTEDDGRFAEQVAARAAVAVENARLYTERSQIATTLQQSLLPDALPEIEGWEIASLYRPARTGGEVDVGGDFYDVFKCDRGWIMLIGDVTGKGVEAAAMTSLVRYGARFVGEQLSDPAGILARLDTALRHERALSLCSALCLRIEDDRVYLASAGHPLPLVVTDDGVRAAGTAGPVLGAFEDSEWPTEEFVLRPEEVLLLYTDGVTDTIGPEGRFGDQRLHRTTAECGPLPANQLLTCLDKALSDFQVGPQADDTAVLALRLSARPAAKASAGARDESC
ncbi:MAG: SpoIIE family protein phosphatase [Solirubrobacterales bacterium]|nr:SpoIIE family protein phosphatase [Solirubrobacterales bacterium]